MRKFRPGRRVRRVNMKRFGLVVGVAAAAVVLVVAGVNLGSAAEGNKGVSADNVQPEIVEPTYEAGITVGGVTVAGKTLEEARTLLAPVEEQMMNKEVVFSVKAEAPEGADTDTSTSSGEPTDEDAQPTEATRSGGDAEASPTAEGTDPAADAGASPSPTASGSAAGEGGLANGAYVNGQKVYTYKLTDLGIMVNTEAALQEALAYTAPAVASDAQETEATRSGEEATATPAPTVDFPLEYVVHEDSVPNVINYLSEADKWGVAPVNAKYHVETSNDKNDLTTWGSIVESDEGSSDGYSIDAEAVISTIESQIETGEFVPFEAPVEVLPASVNNDEGEPFLMASGTTTFRGSISPRKFNIWKISSMLNGAILYPGEVFSVNDHVGPRNAENGWAEALGIENGVYTPQYGGGICQVSSTLYNSALKAEIGIVERQPHTIMADYTKPGLDATISTGSPDLKLENPYDEPMYIVVKCSVRDESVTVELYGTHERDYTVDLYSELVSDADNKVPDAKIEVNSSIDPYAVNKLRPGRRYEEYDLFKKLISKDTEEVIEEGIKVGHSTYPDIQPIYEIGSSVPYPEAGASFDSIVAAAAAASGANTVPVDDIEGGGTEVPPDENPTDEGDGNTPTPTPPPDDGGDDGGGDDGGGDDGGDDGGGDDGGGDDGGDVPPPEPETPVEGEEAVEQSIDDEGELTGQAVIINKYGKQEELELPVLGARQYTALKDRYVGKVARTA